jgi:hypothetical protein
MASNPRNTASQIAATSISNTALERTTRFAACILDRGRFSWVWVVPTCPYCNKSHDHYGGPLDSDPYIYVGRLFAARCDSTDRRRLAPEYPSLDLWYILEPIQSKDYLPETGNSRSVGGT